MNYNIYRVDVLGLKIARLNVEELLQLIIYVVLSDNLNITINYANAWTYVLARQDAILQNILNEEDSIILCDGVGTQLAAKCTKNIKIEKLAYNEWMWKLLDELKRLKKKVYILGSHEKSTSKAIYNLNRRYPELKVAGHNGYFHSEELNQIVTNIRKFKPSVLIVGMGMPKQEIWSNRHKELLSVPVIINGGAIIDYISGSFPMTPKLFKKLNLEWLFRLIHDPKRLFYRYTFGNLIFLYILFKNIILRR